MIITLSGLPGAGKSMLKHALAKELNLKPYSIGDLRGQMARARGLTIDEFNVLGMKESFTDNEVDDYQKKLGETEDDFIIDGWLAWHFIPQSIKLFLTIDPKEGATRIFNDRQSNPDRADEPLYKSIEETEAVLAERIKQTDARYKKWYGLDYLDQSHYDVVIDTTNLTAEESLATALAAISQYRQV